MWGEVTTNGYEALHSSLEEKAEKRKRRQTGHQMTTKKNARPGEAQQKPLEEEGAVEKEEEGVLV